MSADRWASSGDAERNAPTAASFFEGAASSPGHPRRRPRTRGPCRPRGPAPGRPRRPDCRRGRCRRPPGRVDRVGLRPGRDVPASQVRGHLPELRFERTALVPNEVEALLPGVEDGAELCEDGEARGHTRMPLGQIALGLARVGAAVVRGDRRAVQGFAECLSPPASPAAPAPASVGLRPSWTALDPLEPRFPFSCSHSSQAMSDRPRGSSVLNRPPQERDPR